MEKYVDVEFALCADAKVIDPVWRREWYSSVSRSYYISYIYAYNIFSAARFYCSE